MRRYSKRLGLVKLGGWAWVIYLPPQHKGHVETCRKLQCYRAPLPCVAPSFIIISTEITQWWNKLEKLCHSCQSQDELEYLQGCAGPEHSPHMQAGLYHSPVPVTGSINLTKRLGLLNCSDSQTA